MNAKLVNNLEELKLEKMINLLPEYLDEIARNEILFEEALLYLTDRELVAKREKASKTQLTVAHFPFQKRYDEFDYTFQPSVNKTQIKDLCSLRFIENKENIVFYGTPGVGKTHLAVSIGMEAALKRNQTYFISAHDLIQNLRNAYDENRVETRLKHYSKYKVLIIDEVGYLPIDTLGANLFFQLISKLGHISHLRPTVALEAIAKEISRDSQLKAHWLSNSVSDLTQEWRNNSQCKDMLSLTEWLNEFGYHSERELNLQWPSYSEVPEIIIDKILTNITQVSQTTNLQATQSETEIHLRLKAEGFKDRRARALTKDILFLRELLWWREEFKDLSTRYYHLVRQISLLLGTRYQQLGYIESSTDVFYLEKEALQLWMKQQLSPIQLRALIEQNKGYCEAYENYQPMGDLQTGLAQQQSVNLAHDIQLKGIGGNDGIVEAKVRVLTELSQLNELETGEILVTRFTDTGWSHRFGRLAGLITETGGVLSHATIVAREFGLPTIIGAKDATRLLKTGMLIRMNGASGEIQIIKKTGELEGGN